MAGILYSAYAIAVLLVAVGGLLAVVFGTPTVGDRPDYRSKVLALVAAAFIVAMIGGFVL